MSSGCILFFDGNIGEVRITPVNNSSAKYGAGRYNFMISNIADLVRGWTVFD